MHVLLLLLLNLTTFDLGYNFNLLQQQKMSQTFLKRLHLTTKTISFFEFQINIDILEYFRAFFRIRNINNRIMKLIGYKYYLLFFLLSSSTIDFQCLFNKFIEIFSLLSICNIFRNLYFLIIANNLVILANYLMSKKGKQINS